MARFSFDPSRINYSIQPTGKEYELQVLQRAHVIFNTLLGLLPSNYTSTVQGPNYTVELKAMAVELAKIELALEDLNQDADIRFTRSDFLYSVVGYLVFLNGQLPAGLGTLAPDDAEFRKFLIALIDIYFRGSVPGAVKDAVQLLMQTGDFSLLENFLLIRKEGSALDISDQWGFQVVLDLTSAFPPDLFNLQSSLRTVLDAVRPSHTIFSLRYLFSDVFDPDSNKIVDSYRWAMTNYYYDDVRSNWGGFEGLDRLGRKQTQRVVGEDHSLDF